MASTSAKATGVPAAQARRLIGNYLNWYNQNRPHSRLADQTPDEALCHAASDKIGSLIASAIPLKNPQILSERTRQPLTTKVRHRIRFGHLRELAHARTRTSNIRPSKRLNGA
ncbi:MULTISPECIES: integrase core domain-containing protein [Paraburkholderia]|uniref:integrase core domain-containing protein n=1 Tax=Paraburkholderia TaxID=1822464 RepID=UPI0038BA583A